MSGSLGLSCLSRVVCQVLPVVVAYSVAILICGIKLMLSRSVLSHAEVETIAVTLLSLWLVRYAFSDCDSLCVYTLAWYYVSSISCGGQLQS